MNELIKEQKRELRQTIKKSILSMTAEQRTMYNLQLAELFFKLISGIFPENQNNPTILGYMPLPDEPDITGIMQQLTNSKLVLPVSEADSTLSLRLAGKNLIQGRYNISEPPASSPNVKASEIDLALIPGRAFSRTGARLGRGKGYYDRFLNEYTGITVGLCYQEQLFASIPVEEHDKFIDYIITPSQIIHPAGY